MAGSKFPPQAYTRDTLAHAYEWLKAQPPSIREMATSADYLVSLYLQSKRRLKDGVPSYGLDDENTARSKRHFKNELQNLKEQVKVFDESEEAEVIAKEPPPVINTEAINRIIREPAMDNPPVAQPARKSVTTPLLYNNYDSPEDTVAPPHSPHSANVIAQPQVQVVVQQPAQQPIHQPAHPPIQENHAGTPPAFSYQQPQTPPSQPPHQNQQVSPQITEPQHQQNLNYNSPNNNQMPYDFDPITKGNLEEVRRRLNLSNDNEALRVLVAIGYDKLRQILPNN